MEQARIVPMHFPVDLGIVGQRVCFISKSAKKLNMNSLKKLTFGNGQAWLDNDILNKNGLLAYENPSYEGLFKMVSAGRIDLFCRGINELKTEYNDRIKNITNLEYDKSFILKYDLPRFFYTNKANKAAIQRITKGLMIAYNDGSLLKLWRAEYQSSLDFVELKKRKVFKFKNHFLKKINFDYNKYDF